MNARLWLAAWAVLGAGAALAQNQFFGDWPTGTDPRDVGKRVAERFIPTPHKLMDSHGPQGLHYAHVGTWVGALEFADLTKDADLMNRLVERFEPFMATHAPHVPTADHVDGTVFGQLPLELYLKRHHARYRTMGLAFADAQWDNPNADGLTPQTRWWIDDMYMITALQLQAWRATGDAKYRDRAAREMVAYLRKLQQPDGLFFHAPDVKFYWGRGDGWVAVGMTEMLRELPAKHPSRKVILEAYRRMMATLLTHQADSGMWRQLIDKPESWPETSSTAMFTYAYVTGVRNGWLEEAKYGPAARKAWIALVGYLTPDGDLREVCVGTGKRDSYQYYLDRPREVGDTHGQAPMLWSATALLRGE